MKITILGARGSVPVNGSDYLEFGGSTSCVLVETDGEAIFLDAGTGIIHAPDVGEKNISVLITHPHLDHLMGLPFFPYNGRAGRKIDVYGRTRGEDSVKDQLDRLISPPYWPCTLSDFKAAYSFHELETPFVRGDVTIDAIESRHPGGCLVYKITAGGKSVVYATDYEYCDESASELTEFSKGADLLMIDGQYTDEEISTRKGYGHSTVMAGMSIMRQADAKFLRYVHHDPRHSDDMLKKMEDEVKSDRIAFAREGEVIVL